ncbi:mCG146263, partial [Mus musculus]
ETGRPRPPQEAAACVVCCRALTQLLQGRHAIGVVMVLLDLSSAALHLLAAHSHRGLLGQLHAADEGLKALVDAGLWRLWELTEARRFTAMLGSSLPATTPGIPFSVPALPQDLRCCPSI